MKYDKNIIITQSGEDNNVKQLYTAKSTIKKEAESFFIYSSTRQTGEKKKR